MKKLLIPALLLVAASSYGADLLTPLVAGSDREKDYKNWFTPEFNVASDIDYIAGSPSPLLGLPIASNIPGRRNWDGWIPNWAPTGLGGPILGKLPEYDENGKQLNYTTKVEFAFLGETAGWMDTIGYRITNASGAIVDEDLLSNGIQAFDPDGPALPNRSFGDYWETVVAPGEYLDFFVVGTQTDMDNAIILPDPIENGGRFFVFDENANSPLSASMQSYYGTLTPLKNYRVVDQEKELSNQAWTVMGFEDIQPSDPDNPGPRTDYNDMLFAFRSADFGPSGPTVPEPSTYGLMGAVALLALAGYRRFKKA